MFARYSFPRSRVSAFSFPRSCVGTDTLIPTKGCDDAPDLLRLSRRGYLPGRHALSPGLLVRTRPWHGEPTEHTGPSLGLRRPRRGSCAARPAAPVGHPGRPRADVIGQIHILRQSPLRWAMHMALCYGTLLLLVLHTFDEQVTARLFPIMPPRSTCSCSCATCWGCWWRPA
ncbi:MAG: hypothetical protein MZV70_29360 [Desulfobacterales bacterium]|nr:hypothetical protein [Desulfobacterales bacterium]